MPWKIKSVNETNTDSISTNYTIQLVKQEDITNKEVYMTLPSTLTGETLLLRIAEFIATLEE